jgi:hypothetical protein
VKLARIIEEYAKHSVLNLGQALHGVAHVASHPDVDEAAPRGSLRHLVLSARRRARRIGNDLFFAAIPPHWHHTPEDLRALRGVPIKKWFFYGFAAWQFTESGDVKADASTSDRRWDPRCKQPSG